MSNRRSEASPLVTFILLAYNQEKWVRDAVRGALSQDYSPLEIIISDDNSSDRTFDIMKTEVASYFGPHKIVLNQNCLKSGIARHLSKLVWNATGELVVYACGDDISLPQRTRRIVDLWQTYGKSSILIQSRYQSIGESGKVLLDDFKLNDGVFEDINELCRTNMFVVGSASAYTKDVITMFPDLMPDLVHEDCCTPFRARLLGAPVVSIDEALVLYRRVGVTSTYANKRSRVKARTFFRRCAVDYLQKKIDAESLSRSDLIPLIEKKRLGYLFAERCADPSASAWDVAKMLVSLRPPIWFSLKQIFKFRLGIPT